MTSRADNKGKKDFELFQKEFKKWQYRFGLTGYQVYFKYEPLDDSFADISLNQNERVVTIRLNSTLPDKDKPYKDVARSAKHEAIHLLLGELEYKAKSRYVSPEEIYEVIEELVFKLEELITN